MTLEIPEKFNIASWFVDRPAKEHPDRVAILGERETTYGELRSAMNRAGNALGMLGCTPGDRVLIALPDSLEFVTSFFGAAKIGALPVPVSPSSSASLFSHYVSDCTPRVVIAHDDALPAVQKAIEGANCHLVAVGCEPVGGVSPELEAHPTAATDPAFLLYTSGSTGSPKAAVHRHRSMYVTTRGFAEQVLEMGPEDRVLSIPHLFYAYGLGNGMYFPLAMGAQTILSERANSLEGVTELTARHRPTILFSVPTFLRAWFRELEEGPPMDLSSIRLLVYGGEPSSAELFEQYRERFGIEMLEGFGSTEMLQTFLSNRRGSARIGTCGVVVPYFETRIVGDDGEPVTDGEIGTLWLKGQSSLIEYWNRPEDTAHAKAGEWVTNGDKFSRDSDGFYHFRGRADHVIKVLGKWVSLVEIEAILSRHPGLEQVAVVTAGDRAVSKRILAYAVPRGNGAPTAAALRQFLSERLPGLAAPVGLVLLDELPLTSTGKIDRVCLGLRSAAAEAPPQTATERQLARIWSSVLDVSGIQLHDNFLDLGGNSLLGMQCVSRIRSECGVDVSLEALIGEESELSTVAAHIERARRDVQDPGMDVA